MINMVRVMINMEYAEKNTLAVGFRVMTNMAA